MEPSVRQVLAEHRAGLCREVPEGHEVLGVLERAGLALQSIEPAADGTSRGWLLHCVPPTAVREQFDLAPELLVVLSAGEEAQARDITAAERALGRDHRLDRGLVVFIERQRVAGLRAISSVVRHTGRMYLETSLDDVLDTSDPERWFRELLGDRINRSDLFAAGRPVFGWDFVGREQELRSLRGRLLGGHPVGLYGLRKVGKTSLLFALRDRLVDHASSAAEAAHAIPIHVDLLAVSFDETNLHGVMRLVLESIVQAIGALGITEALELPARIRDDRRRRALAPSDRARCVVECIERLLHWSSQQPSRPPVLLLIDEYERLLGGSRISLDDGLDVLDFLRGLTQQHRGAFNFLVAGLDDRRAAQARFGSRQNPLFDFLVPVTLAGLGRDDTGELVRKIGRRLSLHFTPDALDLIWRETGGHPFLAREYGRTIDAAVPSHERRTGYKTVDVALTRGCLEQFRRGVRNTMREIHDTMMSLDPHAVDLLCSAREPEDLHALPPETLDTLRALGIVGLAGSGSVFRISSFEAWLAHNHAALPTAVDG